MLKAIIAHLKVKSLFLIYEIVNTRLNFLEFMKATQFKYTLNTNLLLKVLSLLLFSCLKVRVERSF